MPRLVWDQTGDRLYETGVDHGVLYPMSDDGTYPKGVAWNGLTQVQETPDGAEPTDLWADNIKYLSLRSAETFGGTIEAYTYPDEWMECDGSKVPTAGVVVGQQPRKAFGMSYRTVLGNDVKTNDYGYKLHLIYNCTASPSERAYETINDSPDAITFSWEFESTPVNVTVLDDYKATSLITIDSTKVDAAKLKTLEDTLYGQTGAAKLPSPDEVLTMLGVGGSGGSGGSTGGGSGTTP